MARYGPRRVSCACWRERSDSAEFGGDVEIDSEPIAADAADRPCQLPSDDWRTERTYVDLLGIIRISGGTRAPLPRVIPAITGRV